MPIFDFFSKAENSLYRYSTQNVLGTYPKLIIYDLQNLILYNKRDQMAKLFLQYLAIYKNEKLLAQHHQCFIKVVTIFCQIQNKPSRNSQIILKFCQIWSYWFSHRQASNSFYLRSPLIINKYNLYRY